MGSVMSKPFSQRNKLQSDAFRYDVPKTARLRIIMTLSDSLHEEERHIPRRGSSLEYALKESLRNYLKTALD